MLRLTLRSMVARKIQHGGVLTKNRQNKRTVDANQYGCWRKNINKQWVVLILTMGYTRRIGLNISVIIGCGVAYYNFCWGSFTLFRIIIMFDSPQRIVKRLEVNRAYDKWALQVINNGFPDKNKINIYHNVRSRLLQVVCLPYSIIYIYILSP